ncbi:MAG: ABC transporter permease [Isosphaeraceae bacterium]
MTTLISPACKKPAAQAIETLLKSRETGIVLALLLVLVATTVRSPAFLVSTDGFRDLLLTPAIFVLLAIGQAMVIITRNIDLSVGSVVGLTAYLTGRLFVDFPGMPVPVVIIAGIALGALLGLINGALIAYAKVPALVVTLGTLYIYRGVDVWWVGRKPINASDMPHDFLGFGVSSFLNIPTLAIIAALVLVAVGWYMKTTRGGRELYAIGSDPSAATLYGLRITKRVILAFVACGALTGLAGVLFAARYGTVDSQAGTGFELISVAAAVVGGIAIFGGSGSVLGAAIGAVLLLTINRALPLLGVQDFWQQAVVGALILGAIALDRVLALRQFHKLIEIRDNAND